MKALVVGGGGLMGRWFCSFLESRGHQVSTVDPRGPTRNFARASSIADGLVGFGPRDAVLVCTTLERSAAALAEVRATGTRALVADICSVKAPVMPELKRLAKGSFKVASLHPMWGPDAVLLSNKNLLVLDCGSRAAVRDAKALFRGTAVQAQELPLARHDRLMGWALSLPHLANLSFSLALARSGLSAKDLELLGGPTLQNQLAIARGVARENKDLYYAIQTFNPETPRVHAALARGIGDFHRALGDKAKFRKLMAACETYYDAPAGTTGRAPRRRRGRERA